MTRQATNSQPTNSQPTDSRRHRQTVTRKRSLKRTATVAGAAVTAVAALAATVATSSAVIAPGTPAKDVHIGLDNDNADNPFIQPPGVTAKQHMDNTDVLFGRANDDLLIGKLGSDTLLAGSGHDIMIGGPEGFAAPNSDVAVGDTGNDVNIWAPGDGSDAFVGNEGRDTMIFAPFVTRASGDLKLVRRDGRTIPRVDIDDLDVFSCTIVPVPPAEQLGAQFLVRFNVNGTPVVTVRQKDVEKVLCPSPAEGYAKVADLTDAYPHFRRVALDRIPGVVGNIVAPTWS